MSDPITRTVSSVESGLADATHGYGPAHEHRPLPAYAVLTAAFGATFGAEALSDFAQLAYHAAEERA